VRKFKVGIAVVGLASTLVACGPTILNAPDTYRGDQCEYAAQIMAEWANTGYERWAVDTAIRESRCRPDAYNRSGASGIFQLMMPLHSQLVRDVCGWDGVFDAHCNIRAARVLFNGKGTRPWGG
jgi:hypothetical protein